MFINFAVLFAFFSAVLSSVSAKVLMERENNNFPAYHSEHWKSSKESIQSEKIELTFAVKQQNIKSLETTLLDISSPQSKNYGKHMTLEAINALTGPKASDIKIAENYLRSFGVNDFKYSSGFLRATVSVAVAESLLETRYSRFTHGESGKTALRCSSYYLPDEVASVIDFVAPTINFPLNSFRATTTASSAAVSTRSTDVEVVQNTPDSLRTLYGVNDHQGSNNIASRQAATAFLDQYYEEKDLQSFYKSYYPTLAGVPISKVIGPNGKKGGIEAALDVEYMSVLGSGVPTEFWSFAGSQPDNAENEPFLDWLYYIGNTTDLPFVFSTSYGEDEVSVSLDYATRMNEEFVKGGARGLTFLFASGDSGVGSAFGPCTTYTPQFPSDSPWVTAVGATTGRDPETAAGLSSGGFSNRWPRPTWQESAVLSFLNSSTALPESSLYNASGRAFPDVSAQGTNYAVLNNGITYPSVAGTSCSSPVFGGIIALLNDLRVQQGRTVLGFLNPALYMNALAFNDVTTGNNPGCNTPGFTATAGWDPATGLGTPNFALLVKALV